MSSRNAASICHLLLIIERSQHMRARTVIFNPPFLSLILLTGRSSCNHASKT